MRYRWCSQHELRMTTGNQELWGGPLERRSLTGPLLLPVGLRSLVALFGLGRAVVEGPVFAATVPRETVQT